MAIFDISFALGFITGGAALGALVWFYKMKIQLLVLDANALSAKLHAQADALTKKV